jgi:prepilin peptidase CpaA
LSRKHNSIEEIQVLTPATLSLVNIGVNMGLIGLLAAFLVTAAISDARHFTISNRLCLAVTAVAPLYIAAQLMVPGKELLGGSVKFHLIATIAIALIVFAVSAGFFALGVMGGGDVKLMAAVSLWTGPQWTLPFLFLTALAGGVVTLFVLIRAKFQKRIQSQLSGKTSQFVKNPEVIMAKLQVPYGIGIAIGGLFTVYKMGFQTYMSF